MLLPGDRSLFSNYASINEKRKDPAEKRIELFQQHTIGALPQLKNLKYCHIHTDVRELSRQSAIRLSSKAEDGFVVNRSTQLSEI